MKTVTLRIDPSLDRWLDREARRLRTSKAGIVRDALLRQRNAQKGVSVHDLLSGSCGCIKGAPRDISSNLNKHLRKLGR